MKPNPFSTPPWPTGQGPSGYAYARPAVLAAVARVRYCELNGWIASLLDACTLLPSGRLHTARRNRYAAVRDAIDGGLLAESAFNRQSSQVTTTPLGRDCLATIIDTVPATRGGSLGELVTPKPNPAVMPKKLLYALVDLQTEGALTMTRKD